MPRRRHSRGVALAYTLLVSVVLVVFVTALLVRVTQTLRFTRYDEEFVRARHLADSGARYCLVMMRDFDADFYAGRPQPISSRTLGRAFSPEVLGGTFEFQVLETADLGANPFPPAGTYRTIVSTGKSGGRTARTVATVKVTSPLVNYLQLSRGDLGIGMDFGVVRRLEGPILAVPNPALGQRGNVQLMHGFQFWNAALSRYGFYRGDVELAVEIKAGGDIFLQNPNDDSMWTQRNGDIPRHVAPPKYLEGKVKRSDYPGGDIALKSPDVNMVTSEPFGGSLVLLEDMQTSPNQEFTAKVPTIREILKKYRERSDKRVFDVSGYPGGVLVEFHDGKAFVSSANRRFVGRQFDDDLRDEYEGDLINQLGYFTRLNSRTRIRKRLNQEVMWDDPHFPNAPYPGGRRDIDGDGVRESVQGDYFDVYRVERGGTFGTVDLSRGAWTVLYFKTSSVSVPSADDGTSLSGQGPPTAPPLFLRGIVRGKVVVVYDVTDDTLDPSYTKLPMFILGEHEAPDDSTANKIAGTPGIAGGLVYEDRRYKKRPDSRGNGSPDAAILVSRGSLYGTGQPGFWLSAMRKGSARYNYRDKLVDRDGNYAAKYGSGRNDETFHVATEADSLMRNWVRNSLYGVAVQSSANPGLRLDSAGQLVLNYPVATYPHSGSDISWNAILSDPKVGPSYPLPPGTDPTKVAGFPLRWRNARCVDGSRWRLTGSLHGVEGPPYLNGDSRFDYKFQALTADEIENDIGLPVSVVVVGWLRQ